MSLVIHGALETHVFLNEKGTVTILQKDEDGEITDAVVFPTIFIDEIINALEAIKNED